MTPEVLKTPPEYAMKIAVVENEHFQGAYSE